LALAIAGGGQDFKKWSKMNKHGGMLFLKKVNNTCKLNYLPHTNNIFIKVWALKNLIQ
jgi:hypothetical protein